MVATWSPVRVYRITKLFVNAAAGVYPSYDAGDCGIGDQPVQYLSEADTAGIRRTVIEFAIVAMTSLNIHSGIKCVNDLHSLTSRNQVPRT